MKTINYNKIFEASLNEIYIFDSSSLKFLEVNRGAQENLGYSIEELHAMTPIDIKPAHTLETFNKLIIPLQSTEQEIIVFETEHERKNGTHYPVEVHLQLMTHETRPVYVAIILDITRRREAEKQLLKLTIENQRAQLVQTFITDTSHEFRTSLAILNTKGYLLKKGLLDAKGQRHVDVMQEQVKRLDTLVASLQSASVLETTRTIKALPLSVNTLIQHCLEQNEDIFSDRHLTVHLKLQESERAFYGEEHLIKTAICNVVKNACDFSLEGGTIVIETVFKEKDVCIRVKDTGIGILQDDLPHIFDYLYRADSARSMRGGNGLGLSITKRIVTLHHGHIEVESEAGKGSLFVLKMPLQQPSSS